MCLISHGALRSSLLTLVVRVAFVPYSEFEARGYSLLFPHSIPTRWGCVSGVFSVVVSGG